MHKVQNAEALIDYKISNHCFHKIKLKQGDIICVEFSSASNVKIPEGNAFAYARGRRTSISILKTGTTFMQSNTIAE